MTGVNVLFLNNLISKHTSVDLSKYYIIIFTQANINKQSRKLRFSNYVGRPFPSIYPQKYTIPFILLRNRVQASCVFYYSATIFLSKR